jgi:hypothetical protein
MLLGFTTISSILVCSFGGFDLSWWGVLLSVVVSTAFLIPIGIMEAISGQRVNLNVIGEIMIGFLMPGKMKSVMTFKTLTYLGVNRALTLVEYLKLGHYTKIPPKYLIIVQLYSTILSAVINVVVAIGIFEAIGVDVMLNHPPDGWSSSGYRFFLTGNFDSYFNSLRTSNSLQSGLYMGCHWASSLLWLWFAILQAVIRIWYWLSRSYNSMATSYSIPDRWF